MLRVPFPWPGKIKIVINLRQQSPTSERLFITYHGDGEGVDVFDIQETVLPGGETTYVDVQLIPDWHDGLIVLLVPLGNTETKFNLFLTTTRFILSPSQPRTSYWFHVLPDPELKNHHHHVSGPKTNHFFLSYLLARLTLRGLGGGTIRHTEGTNISSPPGPVTSHLLRWLLSFRIASLPLQITFCGAQ